MQVKIWDTAGQERGGNKFKKTYFWWKILWDNILRDPRYHSLAPMYYRGAQAAIVVYDITNAGENKLNNTWKMCALRLFQIPSVICWPLIYVPSDTFERAKTWVKELQRQVNALVKKGPYFMVRIHIGTFLSLWVPISLKFFGSQALNIFGYSGKRPQSKNTIWLELL